MTEGLMRLVAVTSVWFFGAGAEQTVFEQLQPVIEEVTARTILTPHLANLRKLDDKVMGHLVLRQWWALAREVIAESHVQKVDLSVSVRKSVRTLKDEADELVRALNPKYGQAQLVSPAFQWAQNDTCVFLTVKFTVRWNAPGALEVTEPQVIIKGNTYNFSGLGKHSNNKYKYLLGLSLFDNVDPKLSTWNMAAAGRMSVTLRKKWPRKWPRMLANKKMKISNMHVWSERQDALDSTLGGMTTVSNSPVTCSAQEKLYCLATDTCKMAANCTQCPGKTIAQLEAGICTGIPTEKAGLSFKDDDMDHGELGGKITITKARNEFDIDKYIVYYGSSDSTKLDQDTGKFLIAAEVVPNGENAEVRIPSNTKMPEGATHLLVYSVNEHGEYSNPGSASITDAVTPKEKPSSLSFEDEDGERGEVSGTVTIGRISDEKFVDDYALHWGRSATRKIAAASFIRDVGKGPDAKDGETRKDPTHYISRSTKIPDGAQFLLAYAKNSHGDHPHPIALKLQDNTKPCLQDEDEDCVGGIQITEDADPQKDEVQATITVKPAVSASGVSHYVLYWGRKGCEEGGQSGAKNGHIKDLEGAGSLVHDVTENTVMPPDTTHVLVFARNKYGESDSCKDAALTDFISADEQLKLFELAKLEGDAPKAEL